MDDTRSTIGDRSGRRLLSSGRLAVISVLLTFLLVLVVGGTVSAAPALQEQNPTCQSCHPDEYDVWKNSVHAGASLDPLFQEQLVKAHDQGECLKCHTSSTVTGEVPADSDKVMAEGVTCEACHGAYQAGHPAETTMKLPVESTATCRTCHEAAYSGWEKSKHSEKNIECFDCHLAHSQGVRTGSADKLCAACHSDQATQATHSRHGINGVDCTSCHMAKQMTATAAGEAGAQVSASSHSFLVAADVCSGCHASTIHATGPGDTGARAAGSLQVTAAATSAEAQPAATDEKVVAELRTQVGDLQKRLDSLRNTAVIAIGLAVGVGAFMGLVVGLVGMGMWKRNRRTE
jgi:Cytochrome c554 and c-prime